MDKLEEVKFRMIVAAVKTIYSIATAAFYGWAKVGKTFLFVITYLIDSEFTGGTGM